MDERDCNTCEHEVLSMAEGLCAGCHGHTNWQPKGGLPRHAVFSGYTEEAYSALLAEITRLKKFEDYTIFVASQPMPDYDAEAKTVALLRAQLDSSTELIERQRGRLGG